MKILSERKKKKGGRERKKDVLICFLSMSIIADIQLIIYVPQMLSNCYKFLLNYLKCRRLELELGDVCLVSGNTCEKQT